MRRLAIDVQPGAYAVARLDAAAAVPAELVDPAVGGLVSITRTPTELSLVCPEAVVPQGSVSEGEWRLLTVRGPLAFTLTGIIAALANELAAAGVALFTMSTYETDHILVKAHDLPRAVDALRAAGHVVDSAG